MTEVVHYAFRKNHNMTIAINYFERLGPGVIAGELMNGEPMGSSIIANKIFSLTGKVCPTDILLDLGAGPGTLFVPAVTNLGFRNYIAVDGSDRMVSYIKNYLRKDGLSVSVQTANLECAKIDASDGMIHTALACRVISYLKNIEHIFSEASRVLKPGGFFGFDILSYNNQPANMVEFMGSFEIPMFVSSRKNVYSILERNGFKILHEYYDTYRRKNPAIPSNYKIDYSVFLAQKTSLP